MGVSTAISCLLRMTTWFECTHTVSAAIDPQWRVVDDRYPCLKLVPLGCI